MKVAADKRKATNDLGCSGLDISHTKEILIVSSTAATIASGGRFSKVDTGVRIVSKMMLDFWQCDFGEQARKQRSTKALLILVSTKPKIERRTRLRGWI